MVTRRPHSIGDGAAWQVVLMYAAFSALWILLSDRAVDGFFSDPAQAAMAGTAKGLLFVVVTSLLLYALLRRLGGAERTTANRGLRWPVFGLLLIVGAVTAAAVRHNFFHQESAQIASLQAIADLKAQQITDWLGERTADAEFVRSSEFYAALYADWRDRGDTRGRERLQRRLETLAAGRGFGGVSLLDEQGRRLWASASAPAVPATQLVESARRSSREGRTIRLGPYLGLAGRPRLDFLAPLAGVVDRVPVVVLHADPGRWLYPALRSWPVPSTSGEILLLRRDGNAVQFLNDLRQGKDGALTVREPLDDAGMLSAQILRGQARSGDVARGLDYRNTPVVGAVRSIPGTDWFLVAKIDQAELYREGLADAAWMSLAGLLVMAVFGAVLLLWRQRQQLAMGEATRKSQEERLNALGLVAAITDSSEDAIFAKDRDGRYLLFNRAAARAVGKPAEEVLGRDDHALFSPDQAEMLMATDRRVMEENRGITQEEVLDTADGRRIFLSTKGPLHDGSGQVIGHFGISRDITALKAAAEALRARERYIRAVFDNFPFMVWLKDPDSRILVANTAYARVANVAHPDDLAGHTDRDYWEPALAERYIADDRAVLASGRPKVVEEEITEPGRRYWIETYKSPVALDGQVIGTVGFARDISERKQAQLATEQLAADLAATLKAIPDLLFELDEDGRYVTVHAAAQDLLVAPADQLLGRTVREMLPAEPAQTIMDALASAARTGSDYGRTLALPLTGGLRHFELSVARKSVSAGALQHFVVLSRDITERWVAEEGLRRNNEELQRFNRATVGRELDMIELKRKINALSRELGRDQAFDLGFLDEAPDVAVRRPAE